MKNTIKQKAVYQILENSNPIRRKPRIVPAGVFVEVIDIGANGYAQCKVLHIMKQSKEFPKLRCGQKVFFSLVNLSVPDLFPGLHSKPSKWLNAVKNPEPVADAIQKIVEKRHRGKDMIKEKATASVINTLDGYKKLLKEGQIFKSDKAPTLKIETVTSQGNIEYKMLDKITLKSIDEFLTYLTDNAYWTTPTLNWRRTAKTVWAVMSPFLGMLGAIFITKLLEKRVLK